ncbi:MAG TPA: Hint domain-containing protein [Steroidobacteraceae bacterium]|jgi:hypothetical protein|nr:Hint domain-containing protein [Steroidobacteraceae bacterium]
MSKAVQAIVGVVEIAAGAVLDYFSYGALGNTLILAGASQLLGYAVSLLMNPRRGPLIPIGAAYAGTLEPRRILFGTLKLSGMYTNPPMTSGANNDYLDLVLTVVGHPVTGFGDMYLNQIRIANGDIGAVTGSSADGAVTNTITNNGFQGKVWLRRYAGAQTVPDFILNTTYTAWDSNHVGKSLTYWAVRLQYDTVVFATGAPNISGIVQGAALYDPRLDSTNGGSGPQRYTTPSTWTYSTNPALALRWYLTSALGLGEAQTRIDDTLVAAAANICDEQVSVPAPVVPGLVNWQNGSTGVGGIGTAFLRDLNGGNFTQVGANFFPAPGGTNLYILGPDSVMHQVASVQSDIALTLVSTYTGTSAYDQVTQQNTSTATTVLQTRYTCNTLLDATDRFEDNIALLARAMMGQCVYSGGMWRMYAGAWTGSAFNLQESDLIGGVSIQCATPRQNLYNAVRGNFINPARDYVPDEFPAILNSTYSTADGETIYTETNFPACTNIYEAQRNAFIVSRVSRDQRVVTAQFGMSAYGVKVWETGTLTIAEIGWVNQTVRCIGWKFTPKGAIELQLQEAYSADWTDPLPANYVIKGANATGATSLYLPYPPTALTATPVAGGISFQVTLPSQAPLGGSRIQLFEYTASTPFSSATLIVDATSTSFFVPKFDTVTRYYWVRVITPQNQASGIYPATTGVAGVALTASAAWDLLGNLLSTEPWDIGVFGTQDNYIADMTNTGGSNAIVLGDGSALLDPLGPFGNTLPVWRAIGGSAGSGIVGWHDTADLINIDSTKTYRVTLWIRFTGPSSAGGMYFGTDDTGGSITNLSPGTVDTNPLFAYGNLTAFTSDKWYLAVGIIHASSYTGGQSGISGIYDPATGDRIPSGVQGDSNGSAIAGGSDFQWTPGVTQTKVRAFLFATTSTSTAMLMATPRFEELNGQEPAIRDLLAPGVVDPTVTPSQMPAHAPRSGILPRGNVMPMVQNSAFTYISNSSSLTWEWTAYTVYRPDGSNFAMTAGNQSVTGLSASTSYIAYAYSAESAPSTMLFVGGGGVPVGTPAINYPPSATYAQLAAALAGGSTLGTIFQGKLTGATTSSGGGGGGGGGGGYGCPHPDQWVLTSSGPKRASRLELDDELLTPGGWSPIVKLARASRHDWMTVEFDNGERVTTTLDHRYVAPDLEQIRAKDLQIGQILASGGPRHLRVVALRLRENEAEAVALELAEPRLYFMTANGPLSHNLKP